MLKFVLPAAAALAFAGLAGAEPPAQTEGETLASGIGQHADLPPRHAAELFKRGDYLPVQYRGDFIEDSSGFGLDAPQEGYRWVRVDGEAYLIRITTGLITDARPVTRP